MALDIYIREGAKSDPAQRQNDMKWKRKQAYNHAYHYPSDLTTSKAYPSYLVFKSVEPFNYNEIFGERDQDPLSAAAIWEKYRSGDLFNNYVDTEAQIITYMPNLVTNISHDYNASSKSWLSSVLESSGKAVDAFASKDGVIGGAGAIVDNAGEVFGPVMTALQSVLRKGLDSLAGGELTKSGLGVTNNRGTVIYDGTQLRTQLISYQFRPKNLEEIKMISNIIETFRAHSSPSLFKTKNGTQELSSLDKSQSSLLVPNFWFIKEVFRYPENTIKKNFWFGPAVLTSIRTNYSPDLQYKTFFESSDPVFIDVELSFTELRIITREDIENGVGGSNSLLQV